MKQRFGSISGALASTVLILLSCSGSSFTSSSEGGSANGGHDSAGASGRATGGTDTGGGATGGGATGGGATGGTDAGGVATGGSGTSGSATGGSANGGTPMGGSSTGGSGGVISSCEGDSDCAECAYPKVPAKPADCYCTNCATTPMTKAECAANQSQYEKVCKDVHLLCPAIACVLPPKPVCKSHMCVAP